MAPKMVLFKDSIMNQAEVIKILLGCAFLALFPTAAWAYVFYKKQPEDRLHAMLTFAIGGLSVFPILLYQYLWKYFPNINVLTKAENYSNDYIGIDGLFLVPISVILTYMFVGVLEEVMKMSSVHAVDDHRIRHIDDAIMFAILAALGFSFTENIFVYFYDSYMSGGFEKLFFTFIIRSLFCTFGHILFSAIFGYYYGIAHFASPILQEELLAGRSRIWKWFHTIFKFKTKSLFHEEKMLEGLALAVGLHAFYNVSLKMEWYFMMVPYLVIGYVFVSHLFEMKENHKRYDLLLENQRNHEFPSRRLAQGITKLLRLGRREKVPEKAVASEEETL